MKKLMSIILAVFLTGCVAVISKNQVGDSALKIDAKNWNGVWTCDNDVLVVKTIDATKGILKIAMIQEKDDEFKVMSGKVTLKNLGENKFINIPFADFADKEEEKEKYAGYFMWAKFERQNDNLIVWIAETDVLKEMIKAGKLKGKIEGHSIIMNDSTEKLNDVIKKNIKTMINWQHPGVYNRIKPMSMD